MCHRILCHYVFFSTFGTFWVAGLVSDFAVRSPVSGLGPQGAMGRLIERGNSFGINFLDNFNIFSRVLL